MPLRKAGKRANKAPKATELNVHDSTITLGEEEAPAAPTTPPPAAPAALESVYSLCPLLSTPEHAAQEAQPTAAPLAPAAQQTQENATEKDEKLFWTEEKDTIFTLVQLVGRHKLKIGILSSCMIDYCQYNLDYNNYGARLAVIISKQIVVEIIANYGCQKGPYKACHKAWHAYRPLHLKASFHIHW